MRAPRTQRLFIVTGLLVSTFAIAGSAALATPAPPTVPHVIVALPRGEVPKYDTIYNGVAKAYDSTGYVSSAVIAWSVAPDGVVAVHQSSTGHSATVEGLAEGVAMVYASWRGLTDSTLVYVTHARVIRVKAFNGFVATPAGVVGVVDTMHYGDATHAAEVRCFYAQAIDRRGGSVTGLHASFKSSNANVARIGTGDSLSAPSCPDTSIDPARMTPTR